MSAGTHNFTIEQGTTFELPLIWKDSQTPPVPINVTGYTARLQARETIASTTVLLDMTTANGKVVTGTGDI